MENQDVLSRFESKVAVDKYGCHLWIGPLDKDGYGTFFMGTKNRRAHRASYFLYNGPIPKGLVINHKCRNRNCVNPDHLEAVTLKENALKDSHSLAAINAAKSTCPMGHPYDATEKNRSGIIRICSICRKSKRKAAAAARRKNDPYEGMV